MSKLDKLLKDCKRKLEGDSSMLACEIFVDEADGQYQASLKVYRYSESLLNEQPESGGLLANASRIGRPIKYKFAELSIGEKMIIGKSLSQAYSLRRYWQIKTGRRFRLKAISKGKTEAVRIS